MGLPCPRRRDLSLGNVGFAVFPCGCSLGSLGALNRCVRPVNLGLANWLLRQHQAAESADTAYSPRTPGVVFDVPAR
jgi:hypothetical protein